MKHDIGTQVNFTLVPLPTKEWSLEHDYGILENIDESILTYLSINELNKFMEVSLESVMHEVVDGNIYHLIISDQVGLSKFILIIFLYILFYVLDFICL